MSDRTPTDQLIDRMIDEMITSPELFKNETYTFKHQPTGIEIWHCSGLSFVKFWAPYKVELTFWQRWKLWRAMRKHLIRYPTNALRLLKLIAQYQARSHHQHRDVNEKHDRRTESDNGQPSTGSSKPVIH